MKNFLILPIMFVFVLLLGTSNVQAKTECYDHWNGDAWHGSGAWAMVMCLDTREYVACEVRRNSNGSKIIDLHTHIALDRGRVIWTTYEYITYLYQNVLLDLVCTDQDSLTYTSTFLNTTGFVWGACGLGTDTGGAACVNDQNENILAVVYDGNGTGTVTRSTSGLKCTSDSNGESCYHSPDAPLTITAVPDAGNRFSGWSGGGCTGNSSTCVVDMSNQGRNVTATFMKIANAPVNYMLLKKP